MLKDERLHGEFLLFPAICTRHATPGTSPLPLSLVDMETCAAPINFLSAGGVVAGECPTPEIFLKCLSKMFDLLY